MSARVYICTNGILTWPGDAADWNGRAVTWIMTRYEGATGLAEKVEYFCGPIGRAFGQHARARKLAAVTRQYLTAGCEVVQVAHSNGCDVVLEALRLMRWPRMEALHLFSAACEADFTRNGLNMAATMGRVGKICVYIGGDDKWLRLAHTLPGKILGYGTLGLHGPRRMGTCAKNITQEFYERFYGHSTWWREMNFTRWMKAVTV